MKLPIDLETETTQLDSKSTITEFTRKLKSKINDAFAVAQQKLGKACQIQKSTYDRYALHCSYQVDDYVLYYDNRARRLELNRPWTGPWFIKKVIMDGTMYQIQHIEPGERKVKLVVHFNYLKPYVRKRDRNQTIQQTDSNEKAYDGFPGVIDGVNDVDVPNFQDEGNANGLGNAEVVFENQSEEQNFGEQQNRNVQQNIGEQQNLEALETVVALQPRVTRARRQTKRNRRYMDSV